MEAVRLVGVDVLGLVVPERPPAEAHQPAGRVVDGERQPVPEAVVEVAAPLRAGDQPRRLQVRLGDAGMEGLEQVPEAVGGVAQAEALDELGRDAPPLQVVAGEGRLLELVGEEGRRRLQRALQVLLRPAPGEAGLGATRQGDAVAHGQRLDGRREVVAGGEHVELDGVAPGAAAEAVEEVGGRIDAERGGLLLVDRAQPRVAPPRLAQPRVVGGDGHDVHRVAHGLHELGGEVDVA